MEKTSRGVLVQAMPHPLPIDPCETAVIVVDMQQGFFSPGGAWDRLGVNLLDAQDIVAPIARVLAAARGAGIPIVYLTMAFVATEPIKDLWSKERQDRWLALARVADATPRDRRAPAVGQDSDILAELAPRPEDAIVVKPRHSGFYNTNLQNILQASGITTLVFTGGTTSVCVESTLRDAYFRDYRCLLLADCVAEPIGSRLPHTSHAATLRLVEALFGWVAESAELVQALTDTTPA